MSMSYIVFSNQHLVSVKDWQANLNKLGFALTLDADGDHPIATLIGHLPSTWNKQEAGFECYPGHATETAEAADTYDEFDFGGPWASMMELYYSGFAGVAGAAMAAAAYAQATGGIVFEPEGGDIFDVETAISHARETESWASSMLAAEEP